MRLISAVAVAAATLFVSSAAGAVTLYSNNFDAENGGNTQLNYGTAIGSFNGLTVSNGTVDLIKNLAFAIDCAGGSGSCVDLDGSTPTLRAGELSTGFYNFNAGDSVTFSFDLSGNQRVRGSDNFYAGFTFGGATLLTSYNLGGAWGPVNVLNNVTRTGISTSSSILGNAFTHYSINFVAGQAGSVSAQLGDPTNPGDKFGPIADNLSLDLTPGRGGVPEPATWAMMILGFGAAGSMIRRRKALTA